jgi:hypothetical protein
MKPSISLRPNAARNRTSKDTTSKEKEAAHRGVLFWLVGFFGAGVTAVFLFTVECHVDFFADGTFLIHTDPSGTTK